VDLFLLVLRTLLGLAALGAHAPAPRGVPMPPPASPPPAFALWALDGRTVLDEDDVVAYSWATHTLTLRPGVVGRIQRAWLGELATGAPFAVVAGGEVCYEGVLTSSLSSCPQSGAVIDVAPPEGPGDRLTLALGYPTPDYFQGPDPRGDERVHRALQALGKLEP